MASRKPGTVADPADAPAPPSGWGCYLLRCADGTLYAGATNDLTRRLARHQRGLASRYTRARLPVVLAYWSPQADRSAALRAEAALKKLPRAAKLALVSPCPTSKPRRRPTRAP